MLFSLLFLIWYRKEKVENRNNIFSNNHSTIKKKFFPRKTNKFKTNIIMANSSEPNLHACSPTDEKHVLLVQYVLGGWISILIVLFGIFSNGLSILILGNQRMRYMSTNIYLLALSIVNLIWLLFYLFANSLRFTLIVPKFLANSHENDHHEYDDFIQR